MRTAHILATAVCLVLYTAAKPAAAQSVRNVDDIDQLIHYAYGVFLGTGFYTLDDRSVFIIRIPAGVQLRDPEPERPGIRLLLPLSIGLHDFDFDFDDIVELDKDDLATISFVPGVELEYIINSQWRLKPFVNLGFGRDISNGESAYIYGGGLKSVYEFDTTKPDLTLGNEFLITGYAPKDGPSHFLSRLSVGLDSRFPTGRQFSGHDTFISTHVIAFFYTNDLEFERFRDEPIELRAELEIGLSFGRYKPFEILGFEFDRLGLAYRFSENTDAVLLVTGFSF